MVASTIGTLDRMMTGLTKRSEIAATRKIIWSFPKGGSASFSNIETTHFKTHLELPIYFQLSRGAGHESRLRVQRTGSGRLSPSSVRTIRDTFAVDLGTWTCSPTRHCQPASQRRRYHLLPLVEGPCATRFKPRPLRGRNHPLPCAWRPPFLHTGDGPREMILEGAPTRLPPSTLFSRRMKGLWIDPAKRSSHLHDRAREMRLNIRFPALTTTRQSCTQ